MSGGTKNSESPCPNCGNEHITVYFDRKPYEYVELYCDECGFSTSTVINYDKLEEVNEWRVEREDEPLTQLPKQTFGKESA